MGDATTVLVSEESRSVEYFGLVFDDGVPYAFDDGELFEFTELVT